VQELVAIPMITASDDLSRILTEAVAQSGITIQQGRARPWAENRLKLPRRIRSWPSSKDLHHEFPGQDTSRHESS
jgi:hypothetical protein